MRTNPGPILPAASSLNLHGRCPLSGDIRQRSVEVAALVEQVADVLRRLQLP